MQVSFAAEIARSLGGWGCLHAVYVDKQGMGSKVKSLPCLLPVSSTFLWLYIYIYMRCRYSSLYKSAAHLSTQWLQKRKWLAPYRWALSQKPLYLCLKNAKAVQSLAWIILLYAIVWMHIYFLYLFLSRTVSKLFMFNQAVLRNGSAGMKSKILSKLAQRFKDNYYWQCA